MSSLKKCKSQNDNNITPQHNRLNVSHKSRDYVMYLAHSRVDYIQLRNLVKFFRRDKFSYILLGQNLQ